MVINGMNMAGNTFRRDFSFPFSNSHTNNMIEVWLHQLELLCQKVFHFAFWKASVANLNVIHPLMSLSSHRQTSVTSAAFDQLDRVVMETGCFSLNDQSKPEAVVDK